MANNSGNFLSPIDEFKSQIQSIVQQLELICSASGFTGLMCPTSHSEVKQVTDMLSSIMWREVARHPQGAETNYLIGGAADILGRNEHTNEIRQPISEWDKTLVNGTTLEQPPKDEQRAYLDQEALESREQDNVDSSSPSYGDDQASVARSRSSGSGGVRAGPLYCKFEGCLVADKPFKFLSKLKDHERSHLAPSFPCLECGLKFKQSRILKKHIARVHKAHQSQGGAGAAHGTISDVTYQDLDLTSQMHAFNMHARQNQPQTCQVEDFFFINPDLFNNFDLIDTDSSELLGFSELTYPSPEGMSEGCFRIFPDDTVSTRGPPDHIMSY